MNNLIINNDIFESIKHTSECGREFWYARELMQVLEYTKWENFEKVIEKAKDASKGSNLKVSEHFPDIREMINLGKGGQRKVDKRQNRYRKKCL